MNRAPFVRTVSAGTAHDAPWAGRLRRTAIAKTPVAGAVAVGRLGLAGDEVADTAHHGGPDQAVYAFAREELDHWVEEFGAPVADGLFGENLTTSGIDVDAALIGERWRIGGVLLEVSTVRIPCSVFQSWLDRAGLDASAWIRRFTLRARPGAYLRVIEEGHLSAGDEIVVEHRPDHDVTATTMFRAMTTHRDLLPLLDVVEHLPAAVRKRVDKAIDGD